jgi:hypothetical protein
VRRTLPRVLPVVTLLVPSPAEARPVRIPGGKINVCIADLYYLSLLHAPVRWLVLTGHLTADFEVLALNNHSQREWSGADRRGDLTSNASAPASRQVKRHLAPHPCRSGVLDSPGAAPRDGWLA